MFELATSSLKFGGELLGFVNRLPNPSWPSFLRRDAGKDRFSRLGSGPSVLIAVDRATVALESQSTGELWLNVVLSNFEARSITIESITIDYWLLQGQSMPEPTVIFRSAGKEVERQEKFLVKIRLFEKEVALAMNTVPNDWVTPESLVREGLFDIVLRVRQANEPRSFEVRQRLHNVPLIVSGAASLVRVVRA